MKTTGVDPRERSQKTWGLTPRCLCGLALAWLWCGSHSELHAGKPNPFEPRVEEVLDTDGAVWKVLIVPRPLYRPHVYPPVCDEPVAPAPRPLEQAPQPMPVEPPIVPPSPKPTIPAPKIDPPKLPAEKNEPAKAEKPGEVFNRNLTKDMELVALQPEAGADYEANPNAKPKELAADGKPMPVVTPLPGLIPAPQSNPFGVEIVPRFSYPVHAPTATCCPPKLHSAHVNPGDYLAVYQSIPFIRSEYIANPSYRHDTTMEILFGQLRPAVIHKNPPQPRPHDTLFPFENNFVRPYSYYSLGPGVSRRGPLPFSAPGAYGANFNFYYPMPTVYRNY